MTQTLKHLSAFQRDILYIICDMDTPYGLGIKTALEEYYGEEVNRGRVYQNLSQLVEKGYLKKSDIDQRTNSYTLTDKAFDAMEHRHSWQRTRAKEKLTP